MDPRATLRAGLDAARTFGARGVLRRTAHEAMRRSGMYARFPHTIALGLPAPTALPHREAIRAFHAAHAERVMLLQREADGILSGALPCFGGRVLPVGFPPDWHRHPLTGATQPADLPWTQLSDSGEGGDIKWIWEPGRFGWALTLARAWLAVGDPRYRDGFWDGLRAFLAANPAPLGPHWMCGQEAGLRWLAVHLAAQACADGAPPDAAALLSSLAGATAARILPVLGYALSQRNNHAVSELAALCSLAHAARPSRAARAIERVAVRRLPEVLHDQFGSCGEYAQHSPTYHRLALHALLLARPALASHPELTALVDDRLARGQRWLQALSSERTGEAPNRGSNDGALLLPFARESYRDLRPLLLHLAVVTGIPGPQAPGWLGEEAAFCTGRQPETAPRPSRLLRIAPGDGVVSRVGPFTALLRAPTHFRHRPADADTLHLDVRLDGRELATDPGTHAYTPPPAWAGALAETRHHNTISVAGTSQFRRVGRFFRVGWTPAEVTLLRDTPDVHAVLARTFCDHRRTTGHTRVCLHLPGGVLVLDRIEAPRPVPLRLGWTLVGRGWRCVERGGQTELVEEPDGDRSAVLSVRTEGATRARVVVAQPDGPLGWTSPTYGVLEAATSVGWEVTTRRWTAISAFAVAAEGPPLEMSAVFAAWSTGAVHDGLARVLDLVDGRDAPHEQTIIP